MAYCMKTKSFRSKLPETKKYKSSKKFNMMMAMLLGNTVSLDLNSKINKLGNEEIRNKKENK